MYCLACVCALLFWFLELGFLFQYHSSQSGLSFFSLRGIFCLFDNLCPSWSLLFKGSTWILRTDWLFWTVSFFFNFEQNANASASKKASSSAGRSKLQPPAVDGVSVASLDDNSMDDSEVRPSLNRVNIWEN